MKKIILGMMLVIGSLSFSSDKESPLKISNIFDNFKKEQTQEKESTSDELTTEKSIKISNIFKNVEQAMGSEEL